MSKVAVLGSGTVGEVLANGFLKHGHEVLRASRDPEKLQAWRAAAGSKATTGTFAEGGGWGDIIVLAVKGTAAETVVDAAGPERLAGKLILDTTNPIAELPPENGVLRFFTDLNQSLMERLQKKAPEARFVKAFSCVGSPFMVEPKLPGGPPTMFICGDDAAAKSQATDLLQAFGWDVADMGKVQAARAIEPLCMLWCIPGLLGGGWSHAFKLLRA